MLSCMGVEQGFTSALKASITVDRAVQLSAFWPKPVNALLHRQRTSCRQCSRLHVFKLPSPHKLGHALSVVSACQCHELALYRMPSHESPMHCLLE